MQCHEYITRKREASDPFGNAEWTEALIDGQWTKHGSHVLVVRVDYANGDTGRTTIQSRYEKGSLVSKSEKMIRDRDTYDSDF